MFYLKKPCGCITLCDDTVDLTKPRTMGTGHEMVVYGCTTIKQTFQNSKRMPVLPAPESFISRCEKIPLDSPEGRRITESIDKLIQRGKQGKREKQEKRAMEFTPAVDEDWDDVDDVDDVDENTAEKFFKSLFDLNISPNPSLEASKALGIGDEIPPFPSTGNMSIDEFTEFMGLDKTVSPDEVMQFKGYLQTAQRWAAIAPSSPLTDKILDYLREKCCNLIRKALNEKLGELSLGQLRR